MDKKHIMAVSYIFRVLRRILLLTRICNFRKKKKTARIRDLKHMFYIIKSLVNQYISLTKIINLVILRRVRCL